MPTASNPPRCPHRVAILRTSLWLAAGLAAGLGTSTATKSVYGQETDLRIVDHAGHVQPWPDDEPEILINPPASLRVASRLLLQPSSDSKEKKSTAPALKNLPDPANEAKPKQAEVLVVPQADNSPAKNSPLQNCYQAPPLASLSVNIALPEGKLPTNKAADCLQQNEPTLDPRIAGVWRGTEFHWSATCMRHRPLYFEEINAERYGYTVSHTFQPVISGTRFFASIAALPYKMVIERPRECIYTLGHYRPGSCVPRRWHRLPFKLTAAAVETGVIAGLILILP